MLLFSPLICDWTGVWRRSLCEWRGLCNLIWHNWASTSAAEWSRTTKATQTGFLILHIRFYQHFHSTAFSAPLTSKVKFKSSFHGCPERYLTIALESVSVYRKFHIVLCFLKTARTKDKTITNMNYDTVSTGLFWVTGCTQWPSIFSLNLGLLYCSIAHVNIETTSKKDVFAVPTLSDLILNMVKAWIYRLCFSICY